MLTQGPDGPQARVYGAAAARSNSLATSPFSGRRIHLSRSAYRQHPKQRRRDRLHSGVAGRERLRAAISSKITDTGDSEQDHTLDRTRSTLVSEQL